MTPRMMPKFVRSICPKPGWWAGWLLALLVGVPAARAWNHVGHRTIAEMAWRQMNPEERRAASDLLKQHPHYKELLVEDVPKGVDRDEWAFLTAAIWPDLVRQGKPGQRQKPESITKYAVYPHGVGHPFLKAGDTNLALLTNFFIAKPDAEMVLSNSLLRLKDPALPAAERAVSLCWVLHLFGDLHQPLHTANLVTADRPDGSGLGGKHIVLDRKGERTDLHSFWDRQPGGESGYKPIAKLADKLMGEAKLKPEAMPEYQTNRTIAQWVQEGYQVAVNFAYSEKHVRYVLLDELKGEHPKIPQLSRAYAEEAREIAYRRVVLAGRRLTDELKQVW